MIAYEDLVVALANWRANQGLSSSSIDFLSPATGSVDLALPVSDPIEMISTSEAVALDNEAMEVEASIWKPLSTMVSATKHHSGVK